MWMIFILSTFIIAFIAMVLVWIGNKLYLAIKRDNQKFDNEIEGKKTNE